MDNHLHVLVRLDLDAAKDWSEEEVVRRWIRVYPPKDRRGKEIEVTQAWIDHQRKDENQVARMRERLTSQGPERAATFSWRKSAEATLEVLRSVAR